jgi:hypothetical protein
MSPISASITQGGELPDAGQRPEYLDSRVSLGAGVQFAVDPVGQRL